LHYSPLGSLYELREYPTPPQGGVNTPQLSHNTPTRLQGERREREEGDGWGKGRGEEKGREGTPMGWLKPPCSKS